MNLFKQISITFTLGIFIVPQITFAAWWNPFTWQERQPKPVTASQDILSTVSNQASEIEKLKQEINALKKPAVSVSAKSENPSPVIQKRNPRPLDKKPVAIQPTMTVAPLGVAVSRSRVQSDDIASVTILSADNDIAIKSIFVTLKGDALKSGIRTPVSFIDVDTNALWGNSIIQYCIFSDAGTCNLIFTPDFIVSRNTNKTIRLMVDSTALNAPNFRNLLIKVEIPDVAWSDKSSLKEVGFAYDGNLSNQSTVNQSQSANTEQIAQLLLKVLQQAKTNANATALSQRGSCMDIPSTLIGASPQLQEQYLAASCGGSYRPLYIPPSPPINYTAPAPSYSPPITPLYQAPLNTRCEYDQLTRVTNCRTY